MDRRTFLVAALGGSPLVAGCGGTTGSSTPTAKLTVESTTPVGSETTNRGDHLSGDSFELSWSRLPGPQSGPVNDLEVSAADPAWIYAVTATSGHMFSADGGTSWRQGNEADHHGREIFASPHDSQVAYSQTNRTDDGGKTWYRVSDGRERLRLPGHPGEEEVTDVAWDPFDPETRYVCTSRAFYRSRDGGLTWSPVSIADRHPPDEVFRVAAHPSIEGLLLVGFPDGDLYRTTDRGDSWTAIDGQDTITETPMFIAFSATDTGEAYVGTGGGALLAVGNGDPTVLSAGRSLFGIRGNTSDPLSADGERLYFLGERKSTPDEWTLFRFDRPTGTVSKVETPEQPVSVTTHPEEPATVYMGGLSWVYESQDGGETWARKANGFVERYLLTVGVNPDQPGTVITGTVCQGGLFVSRDGGRTFAWKRSGIPPFHREGAWGEHYVMDVAAGGNRAYATTSAGLLISGDDGQRWRLLESEFSGSGDVHHGPSHDGGRETYDHLHGLGIDPADPGTVYVGTGRGGVGSAPDSFDGSALWKSRDGGTTWREITNGFPTHLDTIVQTFLVSEHDSDVVYVGTKGSHVGEEGHEVGDAAGLFRSVDAGDSWQRVSTPFQNMHAIAEAPDDPDRVMVTSRSGLFRSEDGGASWETLLQRPSKGLLTHPTAPGVVFAGVRTSTDYWDLLVSVDEGDSWGSADLTIQVGIDPDARAYDGIYRHAHYRADKGQITALAYESDTSRLYAAVRGSGLWQGEVERVMERAR